MKAYKNLFLGNLATLKEDINSYANESDLWLLKGSITNSPANLALHVCGNLKHNIGTILGNSGYIRNRNAEFSATGLSKHDILIEIDSTISMISPVFDSLSQNDLLKPWPNDFYGEGQTIGSVIVRLAAHFGYHLGQINYHRRLLI
jgi:hypothetical protein